MLILIALQIPVYRILLFSELNLIISYYRSAAFSFFIQSTRLLKLLMKQCTCSILIKLLNGTQQWSILRLQKRKAFKLSLLRT